jgi:hypothetical protein
LIEKKKPNVETIETIQSTTFRELFFKTPMLETNGNNSIDNNNIEDFKNKFCSHQSVHKGEVGGKSSSPSLFFFLKRTRPKNIYIYEFRQIVSFFTQNTNSHSDERWRQTI